MQKTLLHQDNPEIHATIKTARSKIYEKGYAVTSEVVKQILKEKSLVPADPASYLLDQNTFSSRLSHLSFDLYVMLVVDLLHEFELGVWRALLIQLIRILSAIDASLVNEMDRR
ncbi:hypothetical protein H0H81_002518 [Sphagnurus paluster]|uniref:Uncharacterized protein n=1 Tax=Sphagnurus paluster TaxID=117069 RepID=A0A9P7FP23_9AGAR|nr:hypothetical protein H0H81_002518 [Sphagnurus paluster]